MLQFVTDTRLNITMSLLPKHLVIIPDGNRRWARKQGLPVWRGHQKGMQRTKELLKELQKSGVQYCTWWGFSTENWDREPREVQQLMRIFEKTLSELARDAHKNKIQFRHFGRKDRLPKPLATKIAKLEKATASYDDFHFGLALDYGGHDELIRAFKKIQKEGHEASEESITSALDTFGFPDPDLIIRTGGEQRVSGIMPWQAVYAELYFEKALYPDFDTAKLQKALAEFSKRERRFGK